MKHDIPEPQELVLTEGEPVPPPEPTVPEPSESAHGHDGKCGQELLEVKRLAERVGGPEKLRELVEVLIRLRQ